VNSLKQKTKKRNNKNINKKQIAKKIAIGVATFSLGSMAGSSIVWASHSESGACVELANLGGDVRGVRDSKNPNGGILKISSNSFKGLLHDIKQGKYGN